VSFIIEDKPLIKRLRVSKSYGAASLCKMFPEGCFNTSPIFFFYGKTHNLQTWKYDVSMTSPMAKNIQLFTDEMLVFS